MEAVTPVPIMIMWDSELNAVETRVCMDIAEYSGCVGTKKSLSVLEGFQLEGEAGALIGKVMRFGSSLKLDGLAVGLNRWVTASWLQCVRRRRLEKRDPLPGRVQDILEFPSMQRTKKSHAFYDFILDLENQRTCVALPGMLHLLETLERRVQQSWLGLTRNRYFAQIVP